MLKNLAHVTSAAAERFGSKPALVFEGRWFSFAEIDAAVAQRLKDLRKSYGLTGIYVAHKLGITVQLLSKYENGNIKIKSSLLYRFSHLYKVPIDDLFSRLDMSSSPITLYANRLIPLLHNYTSIRSRKIKTALISISRVLRCDDRS